MFQKVVGTVSTLAKSGGDSIDPGKKWWGHVAPTTCIPRACEGNIKGDLLCPLLQDVK